MKSFIALCFLAAACAMQASAHDTLDKSKAEVDISKRNVGLTIANLGYTKGNLIRSVNQNLVTLRIRSMSEIDNTVNLALDKVRASVDAAKAKGKDIEHCYTTAEATLHSILEAAISGFQTCETNGRSQLPKTFAPFDKAMATGQAYMPQLDSIIPECNQLSTTKIQTCVTEKLTKINESIKTYHLGANKLILNAQNTLNDVTNTVTSCYKEPTSTASSAITASKSATDKCVKN